MKNLSIGTSTRVIPVRTGMDMTGYIGRFGPAERTHDDLRIHALVFDDGTTRFAFAECDLLGLDREVSLRIAGSVETLTGIPALNVVVACTHTHSGPASIHLVNCGTVEEPWLEKLIFDVAECVREADTGRRPAVLRVRTGDCQVGLNRVTGESDDREGHLDTQVVTLHIADEACEIPHTLLVNFACHPVTLNEDNLEFSRDYPNFLEEMLQESLVADLDVVFATGCCGDIDPRTRGGFEAARQAGRSLAASVLAMEADSLGPTDFENVRILIETITISLPLEHSLDAATLRKVVVEHEAYTARARNDKGDARDISLKVSEAMASWSECMLSALQAGTLLHEIDIEVKTVRMGALTFVFLPFEAFTGIGKALKRHFGPDRTLVVSCANGVHSYMATDELFSRATYETQDAYKYYGYPGPFRRGSETLLLKAIFEGIGSGSGSLAQASSIRSVSATASNGSSGMR